MSHRITPITYRTVIYCTVTLVPLSPHTLSPHYVSTTQESSRELWVVSTFWEEAHSATSLDVIASVAVSLSHQGQPGITPRSGLYASALIAPLPPAPAIALVAGADGTAVAGTDASTTSTAEAGGSDGASVRGDGPPGGQVDVMAALPVLVGGQFFVSKSHGRHIIQVCGGGGGARAILHANVIRG